MNFSDENPKPVTPKSEFGSHREMVDEFLDTITRGKTVVCTDERGRYVTFRNRLDNGMGDPRRYFTVR